MGNFINLQSNVDGTTYSFFSNDPEKVRRLERFIKRLVLEAGHDASVNIYNDDWADEEESVEDDYDRAMGVLG